MANLIMNKKNMFITEFSLKLDPPQSSLWPWHGHRRRFASIGAVIMNIHMRIRTVVYVSMFYPDLVNRHPILQFVQLLVFDLECK